MISVKLDEADYIAAQRLHSRWSKKQWLFYGIQTAVFLCLGAFAWAGVFSRSFENLGFFLVLWVLGAWIGGFIARAIVPWKWRRNFKIHKLLQSPITYSWDTDKFTATSEYGNSAIPWEKFFKLRQVEQSLLLYISKQQFYCIPKRSFPIDAAKIEFCHLVEDNIRPDSSTRP